VSRNESTGSKNLSAKTRKREGVEPREFQKSSQNKVGKSVFRSGRGRGEKGEKTTGQRKALESYECWGGFSPDKWEPKEPVSAMGIFMGKMRRGGLGRGTQRVVSKGKQRGSVEARAS